MTAIAQAGDLDRAEVLARTITDPYAQAWRLIDLVTATARAGDLESAYRLATDAEALARTMTDLEGGATVLAGLVTATAQAGDLDRAEALARTITNPDTKAEAVASLVNATAEAGSLDRDRAARLLAAVLTIDMSGRVWMKMVAKFFPSAIGDAWDIVSRVVNS